MKNINYNSILLCPLRMLEYYFSRGFIILELNSNNLSRIANEAKQIICEIYMHDSYYVMICTTEITSI